MDDFFKMSRAYPMVSNLRKQAAKILNSETLGGRSDFIFNVGFMHIRCTPARIMHCIPHFQRVGVVLIEYIEYLPYRQLFQINRPIYAKRIFLNYNKSTNSNSRIFWTQIRGRANCLIQFEIIQVQVQLITMSLSKHDNLFVYFFATKVNICVKIEEGANIYLQFCSWFS